MLLSVIIPTYNGAHKILHALKSLEQQQRMPDEVLVVVDGSTDGTAAMLREQQFRFPSFRIIEQANGGRAKVRNRGAKEATGSLLVFLDDDMVVPEHWLETHLQHHTQYPGSIVTGALKDPYEKDGTDFQRFKAWLGRKWNNGLPPEANEASALLHAPYITANNFSLEKTLFFALEGFDERLTDAEDYDLAVRAMKQNIPLYLGYTAWGWHYDLAGCTAYIKRMRQYARADERLRALKPELYNNTPIARQLPSGLKSVLFRGVCSPGWIRSVENGSWKWLPESIRYKLYDVIITANGSFYPDKVSL